MGRSRSPANDARRPRSRSRSRSRSHSRSRSKRERRSASRSRERAHRHRSRSRSRSQGDSDGGRRTRTRSSSAEGERRRRQSSKKKDKKREKKPKEKKKKAKREQSPDRGSSAHEDAPTAPQAPASERTVDARDFFGQLQAREAAKPMVGTVHASGVKPLAPTSLSAASDQWECPRATCGKMNSKFAAACEKCGSMKRMSEWR